MKYTINKTDHSLISGILVENYTLNLSEYLIETDLVPPFIRNKWNVNKWEDITTDKDRKVEVPQEVPLWRVKAILEVMKLQTVILEAMETLPPTNRIFAKAIWKNGTDIDRNSQTVLFLQNVAQLTNEQVDEIFIQSKQINL